MFEWNGPMLHAKTAVADSRWARVGSTNLNLTSWIGNWELDVAIEDGPFAQGMEAMYLDDLSRATEVVLTARQRVRPRRDSQSLPPGSGQPRSSARAARRGRSVWRRQRRRRCAHEPSRVGPGGGPGAGGRRRFPAAAERNRLAMAQGDGDSLLHRAWLGWRSRCSSERPLCIGNKRATRHRSPTRGGDAE